MAGRVRKQEEAELVQEVITKHFKRRVDPIHLFTLDSTTSSTTESLLREILEETMHDFKHIVWTFTMRRLAVLIGQCILYNEPVLLVGDTG